VFGSSYLFFRLLAALSQRPDSLSMPTKTAPKGSILLAVDKQLGAGSRPEGVHKFPESAFELIGPHTRKLRRRSVAR
jgi:hypothetical protein